jgi:hypothetical protein
VILSLLCPHIPIGTARNVSSARAAVRIENLLFILFVVVLGCLYLIDSKFKIQRFKDSKIQRFKDSKIPTGGFVRFFASFSAARKGLSLMLQKYEKNPIEKTGNFD